MKVSGLSQEETQKSLFSIDYSLSLLCEDSDRRWLTPSQEERSHRNEPCWHLDLVLLTSRNDRKQISVKSPSLWYLVVMAQSKTIAKYKFQCPLYTQQES